MKRIEKLENDFVLHFTEMLKESFPSLLKFKVDYYLGEVKGKRRLCFEIENNYSGRIFSRYHELKSHEVVADIEDTFINLLVNDLVMVGVTLLNIQASENQSGDRVVKEIHRPDYRNNVPRMLLFKN
jgi:hypothetical protein